MNKGPSKHRIAASKLIQELGEDAVNQKVGEIIERYDDALLISAVTDAISRRFPPTDEDGKPLRGRNRKIAKFFGWHETAVSKNEFKKRLVALPRSKLFDCLRRIGLSPSEVWPNDRGTGSNLRDHLMCGLLELAWDARRERGEDLVNLDFRHGDLIDVIRWLSMTLEIARPDDLADPAVRQQHINYLIERWPQLQFDAPPSRLDSIVQAVADSQAFAALLGDVIQATGDWTMLEEVHVYINTCCDPGVSTPEDLLEYDRKLQRLSDLFNELDIAELSRLVPHPLPAPDSSLPTLPTLPVDDFPPEQFDDDDVDDEFNSSAVPDEEEQDQNAEEKYRELDRELSELRSRLVRPVILTFGPALFLVFIGFVANWPLIPFLAGMLFLFFMSRFSKSIVRHLRDQFHSDDSEDFTSFVERTQQEDELKIVTQLRERSLNQLQFILNKPDADAEDHVKDR